MRRILHRPAFIVGLPVAAALLLAGACSPAPQPLTSRNLERPTDVSFVCVGLFPDDAAATATPDGGTDAAASTARVSGRPMSECHPPLEFDPTPVDVTHRSFGFLTNTARGELSVVDMDAPYAPTVEGGGKLLDLDHGVPGINPVAIGDLPEQMSASDDGCRIVTANRGSCDLSLVDPSALVTDQLRSENKTASSVAEPGRATTRVTIKTPAGTDLFLAPQEILFLPQDTSAETGGANLCPAAIDQSGVTPWRALVTLPSCNLIALVDLPSGTIIDSLQATVQGGAVTLAKPADPNHPCDSGTAAGAYSDCGDHQNPLPAGAQPRPGPLAILPDGSRAYVGFAGAPVVAAVNLTADTLTAGGTIALHEDALGADRIRLSVDPYQKTGQPGRLGRFVGEGPDRLRQYLYVVARDGTVRVVDVSPAARQEPEQECETNLNPLIISADPASPVYDVRAASCVPVDDDPTHHFRRGDARGPGIRLPTVPRDVTFADLKLGDPRQEVLDGSFAFILTSSGAVYIVNIDPTLRTSQVRPPNAADVAADPAEAPPAASSLRDRNVITYTTSLDPATGPARVDVDPVPGGPGPRLQPVGTTSSTDNVRAIANSEPVPTSVFFPVKGSVRAQTWTITWEGDLAGPNFAGQIRAPSVSNPGVPPVPATFTDAGADFCQAGAQTGDIITIVGCTVDSDCGPLRVCRRSETAPQTIGNLPINGLCVSSEPAAQAKDLGNCAALLPTVKRYTIQAGAEQRSIKLLPKLDEVPSALVSGCQSNSDCQPAVDPSRRAFTCQLVDPGDTRRRCVQSCDDKTACRTGRTCDLSRKLCADGPPLEENAKNCLQQLFAYKIQAGNAFIVQGSAPQPSFPYSSNEMTHECLALDKIPGRDPLLVNRIPLDPPPPLCEHAPISTDQATWDATFLSVVGSANQDAPKPVNPCLLVDTAAPATGTGGMNGTGGAGGTNGTGGAGGAGGTDGTGGAVVVQQAYVPHHWIQFQNREIRFLLTHLDEPTIDISQIQFDVHGGFAPDLVVIPTTIDIEMPARIVVSPFDSQGQLSDRSSTHEIPYLYVVDQRRLGRASAGVGPTRGQFLRINPRKANSDGSNLFPVYDEPDTTGGLWPIQ